MRHIPLRMPYIVIEKIYQRELWVEMRKNPDDTEAEISQHAMIVDERLYDEEAWDDNLNESYFCGNCDNTAISFTEECDCLQRDLREDEVKKFKGRVYFKCGRKHFDKLRREFSLSEPTFSLQSRKLHFIIMPSFLTNMADMMKRLLIVGRRVV